MSRSLSFTFSCLFLQPTNSESISSLMKKIAKQYLLLSWKGNYLKVGLSLLSLCGLYPSQFWEEEEVLLSLRWDKTSLRWHSLAVLTFQSPHLCSSHSNWNWWPQGCLRMLVMICTEHWAVGRRKETVSRYTLPLLSCLESSQISQWHGLSLSLESEHAHRQGLERPLELG
jgi:hypothetical protein